MTSENITSEIAKDEGAILADLKKALNLLQETPTIFVHIFPKVDFVAQQVLGAQQHGYKLAQFVKRLKTLSQAQKAIIGLTPELEQELFPTANYVPAPIKEISSIFQQAIGFVNNAEVGRALILLARVAQRLLTLRRIIEHLVSMQKQLKTHLKVELTVELEETVVLNEIKQLETAVLNIPTTFNDYLKMALQDITCADKNMHKFATLANELLNVLMASPLANTDATVRNNMAFLERVTPMLGGLRSISKQLTEMSLKINNGNLGSFLESLQPLPQIAKELERIVLALEYLVNLRGKLEALPRRFG